MATKDDALESLHFIRIGREKAPGDFCPGQWRCLMSAVVIPLQTGRPRPAPPRRRSNASVRSCEYPTAGRGRGTRELCGRKSLHDAGDPCCYRGGPTLSGTRLSGRFA